MIRSTIFMFYMFVFFLQTSSLWGQYITVNHTESIYIKKFKSKEQSTYFKFLLKNARIKAEKDKNHFSSKDKSEFTIAIPKSFSNKKTQFKNTYENQKVNTIFYTLDLLFSLVNYYEKELNPILEIYQLPNEFKILPAVLSAFNPNSGNDLGARGYWHLYYPQAISYKLNIDATLDERRDFKKSSLAASKYLSYLYKHYKNWELTLVAYTCGPASINKAIQQASGKTYWDLYPYLPVETRDIVIVFEVLREMYESRKSYQIVFQSHLDTIRIDKTLHFESIHKSLKTTTELLNFWNPTVENNQFPKGYHANFTEEIKTQFKDLKNAIYEIEDSRQQQEKPIKRNLQDLKKDPTLYRVKSGDVLGAIAEKFGVGVKAIKRWNSLRSDRINIGQQLVIYGGKKVARAKPKKKSEVKKQSKNTKNDLKGYITYQVKKGDNLWQIAKKYPGVSADEIMKMNGVGINIKPGQQLKIKKK